MMRIGIHLSLWTDHPAASDHRLLLEKISSWGADGVEVPVALLKSGEAAALAKLLDELALGRTAALVLHAAEADPASPDPVRRKAAVTRITQAVDRTCELGAELLAGPLFQGLGRFSGTGPTPGEWQWAVETLGKAAEYAHRLGVRLALEPLNRFEMYMANTAADAARFVRDLGMSNTGILVDTHHANIEELDTTAAWQAVFPHIFHMHMSENHRSTPGTGHAIQPETIRMLASNGYQGWLTIEAFGQSVPARIPRLHLWRTFQDDEDTVARKGLTFLHTLAVSVCRADRINEHDVKEESRQINE